MSDPFRTSPFSDAVNAQLRRLLKASWQGDRYLVVPKSAGTFTAPAAEPESEVAFYDPSGDQPDVKAALPFSIRYLEAALSGMQPDFTREGRALSMCRSLFLSGQGRPWITLFGDTSGTEFGMPIDSEGKDPDIFRGMVGETFGGGWKLSEFLASLSTT